MKEIVLEKNFNLNKLTEYQESFIKYLDVDDKTLRAYKVGINAFMNYLKDNDIKQPTRDDLITFRDMLRDNYSSNTVNTYIVAIKSLFRYLEIHKLYENIAIDIKGARVDNTPKKQVLTLEQMKTIYSSLTDLREKALFGLLISTGLRGIEVARARIEDIKVYNNEVVLWVQCKKHDEKDEYVKLSQQVIDDLKEYIGNRKNGYIFTSTSNHNNGGGLTTTSIRRYIKAIFKRFNLDDDSFSLHSTRRSFAVVSYETGSSIYDIQQVLHHASINTTTRYLKQVNRDNNKTEYNVANAILGGA